VQEPDPARPAPATAALSASLLERLGGQPMGLGDLDTAAVCKVFERDADVRR
jgi:hypothetical protein